MAETDTTTTDARLCKPVESGGCGYDEMQAKSGGALLVRLEATVETMTVSEELQAAAMDVADVTYDKFSEREMEDASACVDCLLKFCRNYQVVRQSPTKPPVAIVPRSN